MPKVNPKVVWSRLLGFEIGDKVKIVSISDDLLGEPKGYIGRSATIVDKVEGEFTGKVIYRLKYWSSPRSSNAQWIYQLEIKGVSAKIWVIAQDIVPEEK
jgi:hypothetical protein